MLSAFPLVLLVIAASMPESARAIALPDTRIVFPATHDPLFPTDVGFEGPTAPGAPPFVAQSNPVNASANGKVLTGSSIEDNYNLFNTTTNSTDRTNSTNPNFTINRYWGNNSPYFPSPLFPEWQSQRQLNPKCTIEQVQIMQRHGSRDPMQGEAPTTFATVLNDFRANATAGIGPELNATGDLAFLSSWSYTLGQGNLVANGRQELFDAGTAAWYQYGHLYEPGLQNHKPVLRTTSQTRMLDSTKYWAAGFWGLEYMDHVDLEVIIEGAGFNNTLAPYDTCPMAMAGDLYLIEPFKQKYLADAVKRLRPQVQGLELDLELVYAMQSLCAYETVGRGTSPFCQLFTEEEWLGFEYVLDMRFWGDFSFGSQTGRAQGVGLGQEILSRMTGEPLTLEELTMQNASLINNIYLPLDQNLHVDFVHDNAIISLLTAFNYTQVLGEELDPLNPNASRIGVLSYIQPYGGKLIFEMATCDWGGDQNETIVRTLLNDALIPMTEDQGCTPRADGACLLDEFVEYQRQYMVPAANYAKACAGDYTPVLVNNGTIG